MDNLRKYIRKEVESLLKEESTKKSKIMMKSLGYEIDPQYYEYNDGYITWYIHEIATNNIVGYLEEKKNKIHYFVNPEWEKENIGLGFEFVEDFTQGPKQAARYIWLKRQKPAKSLSEANENNIEYNLGDKVKLKGTVYYAVYYGQNFWIIFDKDALEGRRAYREAAGEKGSVGVLYEDGEVFYENSEGDYVRQNIGVNNIKQALKLVYLQRQVKKIPS